MINNKLIYLLCKRGLDQQIKMNNKILSNIIFFNTYLKFKC